MQLRERGITNFEAQIGVLALAPQKKMIAERKTYSYGIARHGTRVVAANVCVISSSTTEDSEDRERISKSRGRGVTYEM